MGKNELVLFGALPTSQHTDTPTPLQQTHRHTAMSTSLAHAVDPHSEAHQVSGGPAAGHEQGVGSGLETGTAAVTATSTNTGAPSSVDTDSKQGTGPFQGDGADPSQPERLIPQSPMGWVAYTVSLNYNRVIDTFLCESPPSYDSVEDILANANNGRNLYFFFCLSLWSTSFFFFFFSGQQKAGNVRAFTAHALAMVRPYPKFMSRPWSRSITAPPFTTSANRVCIQHCQHVWRVSGLS